MREIIFRGKCVDNGEWVYGVPIFDWYSGGKTANIINVGLIECCDENMVIPETVGQYTGLKDKNGTMIFEGDIISYEDVVGVDDGVGNVLFDLFYGAWIVFVNDYEENSLADVAYNCEIIGNIHEEEKK